MQKDPSDENDDYDDVPLHHKKPFGSGLRRNQIKFVPASTKDTSFANPAHENKTDGQSISNFYLNMVLAKPVEQVESSKPNATDTVIPDEKRCGVCKMPIATEANAHHQASIAHQVCMAHSHPPSAVDRTRMGLSVLESQGWDPDARLGLGAAGQGAQFPIKVRPKDDNLGIGVVVPKDFGRVKKDKERPRQLDAGKVRKMAAEDRRRTDKLQQQIFGKVDLERYLGKGA